MKKLVLNKEKTYKLANTERDLYLYKTKSNINMSNLFRFIKDIKPNGLNYLWINGFDFIWSNNRWELVSK